MSCERKITIHCFEFKPKVHAYQVDAEWIPYIIGYSCTGYCTSILFLYNTTVLRRNLTFSHMHEFFSNTSRNKDFYNTVSVSVVLLGSF
jgi:hypothetical protein